MPDVNWKQRNASEQFIEDALWWLEEFDLDGARIDAVKHVDDLAITNLATRVKQRFETVGTEYYLKGETAMGWAGHDLASNQEQYDTINRYMGENGLDGQADFVLYHAVVDNVFTSGTENYQHLDYWTNRSQDQYSSGSIMVPYVGSHDVPRLVSRADTGTGDTYNQWSEDGLPGQPGIDSPYQAALQAYGWLLTTPGAPLLYYGDEYGEYGGADPDNRHMYRNMTSWSDRESSLFENISQLGQLRANSIALKQGVYSTRYASTDLLIYDMSHSSQNMSVILNRGTESTYAGFSPSDLIKFGDASFSSGELTVPANSVTVIELDVITDTPVIIYGCMDQAATNFNSEATQDDGSCQYPAEPVLGCMDQIALNFDSNATQDDNSCQYEQVIVDNNSQDNQSTDNGNQTNNSTNQTNNSNAQTIQCTGCCGEVRIIVDNGGGCPSVQCAECDEVDIETKSSVSEFLRNGLVVAVFCGVVVLAIMSRKK